MGLELEVVALVALGSMFEMILVGNEGFILEWPDFIVEQTTYAEPDNTVQYASGPQNFHYDAGHRMLRN